MSSPRRGHALSDLVPDLGLNFAIAADHPLEVDEGIDEGALGGSDRAVFEGELLFETLEIAEKKGRTIHPAVATATEKWEAILRAAQSLQSSAVALGMFPNTTVVEDARIAGLAWERLTDPKPQVALQFYSSSGQDQIFYLGPHAPHLTRKEIDLLHGIWLELSSDVRRTKSIIMTRSTSRSKSSSAN